MRDYYRASELEPQQSEVQEIFNKSGASDWIFDDETRILTHRENLSIFLRPDQCGNYHLCYGDMSIAQVEVRDLEPTVTYG